MGIEPTWLAWKARTLPLSYARNVLNHSLRRRFVNALLHSPVLNRQARDFLQIAVLRNDRAIAQCESNCRHLQIYLLHYAASTPHLRGQLPILKGGDLVERPDYKVSQMSLQQRFIEPTCRTEEYAVPKLAKDGRAEAQPGSRDHGGTNSRIDAMPAVHVVSRDSCIKKVSLQVKRLPGSAFSIRAF
jgi:hypothetical protein